MISLQTPTDEYPIRVGLDRSLTRKRAARRVDLSEHQISSLAWDFLQSEFTGLVYADWPIDRRLEAYLAHLGMAPVVNDGDAFDVVLQQVLANVGPALRAGILTTKTWVTSRRNLVLLIGAAASVPSVM